MSFFKNKYENKLDKYKTKYRELQNNIEDHFNFMLEELSNDIEKLQEISIRLKKFENKIHLLGLNEPIENQNEGNYTIVYGIDQPKNDFKLNYNENPNQKALELFKQRDENFQL